MILTIYWNVGRSLITIFVVCPVEEKRNQGPKALFLAINGGFHKRRKTNLSGEEAAILAWMATFDSCRIAKGFPGGVFPVPTLDVKKLCGVSGPISRDRA